MNGDPCAKDVWWSVITASSADSTLAACHCFDCNVCMMCNY
jgi:hypothetical protein